MVKILAVAARCHGRVLLEGPADGPLRLLVGFHGYAQNADEMLQSLRAIEAPGWTRVSVQGLHRFYRGRSTTTVASWMTREDRELLIADNIAYVDAVLARLGQDRPIERVVYCGFSQGVAMAFRAAARGTKTADAVIAVGGDVPPELIADTGMRFPRVLLTRGSVDEFYSAEQLSRDAGAIASRAVDVETLTFDGGHEWNAAVSAHAAAWLSAL